MNDFSRYYTEFDPDQTKSLSRDKYLDFSVWLSGKCAGYELLFRRARLALEEIASFTPNGDTTADELIDIAKKALYGRHMER